MRWNNVIYINHRMLKDNEKNMGGVCCILSFNLHTIITAISKKYVLSEMIHKFHKVPQVVRVTVKGSIQL